MWVIDVHHDFEWVAQVHKNKILPEAKLRANFSFQSAPEFGGHWLLFGDEFNPTMLRVVLPGVEDQETAQKFIIEKLWKIIRSVELSITLVTQRSFFFKSVFNVPQSMKWLTHGPFQKENDLPILLKEEVTFPKLDYGMIGGAMNAQFPELEDYFELLQNGMNTLLSLGFRWLAFFQILEMHFHAASRDLQKKTDWIGFLETFRIELTPFLRTSSQSLQGLMEVARNAAAHYVTSPDPSKNQTERAKGAKLIEGTFPIMHAMVCKVINQHPNNQRLQLKPM